MMVSTMVSSGLQTMFKRCTFPSTKRILISFRSHCLRMASQSKVVFMVIVEQIENETLPRQKFPSKAYISPYIQLPSTEVKCRKRRREIKLEKVQDARVSELLDLVKDDVNVNSVVKEEIGKDDVNVNSLVKEDIEKDDVHVDSFVK
nr:hypothetical protein [Tanacetum cinerariifolium]